MNICAAAKTNVLDCSCLCILESGHADKHNCQCGQSWSTEELLMKCTSDLKEVLPLFKKHFESITAFRHLCNTDQLQLISDLENDSKLIIDSLQNLMYCDKK
jgi:hypothetical protein